MSHFKGTPGEWDYVRGTEHHGPYVAGISGDICDCYAMSNPMHASVRNGGDSHPINHQGKDAEANARLIAAAPCLLDALTDLFQSIRSEDKPRSGAELCELRDAALEKARAAIAKALGQEVEAAQ